jgi:hypothetical protein
VSDTSRPVWISTGKRDRHMRKWGILAARFRVAVASSVVVSAGIVGCGEEPKPDPKLVVQDPNAGTAKVQPGTKKSSVPAYNPRTKSSSPD